MCVRDLRGPSEYQWQAVLLMVHPYIVQFVLSAEGLRQSCVHWSGCVFS